MQATAWKLEEATVKLHEQGAQRDGLDSTSAVNMTGQELSQASGRSESIVGQARPALPFHANTPLTALLIFFHKTLTIMEWEIRKIRHDTSDLLMRMVQPTI